MLLSFRAMWLVLGIAERLARLSGHGWCGKRLGGIYKFERLPVICVPGLIQFPEYL
jgi:hypothetical protein